MLCTLEDTWRRITQVVAALEVGHAVLADQNDYDIDGISLALSKATIEMLRTAAYTLVSLDSWARHPAAPDTRHFLDIVLHAVDHEARHNTAAFRAYTRDETLILYSPVLRDCLERFMMSVTVLTQAECDRIFLTVHAAAHLLVHKQTLAMIMRSCRAQFEKLVHAHHYGEYNRTLMRYFARAKAVSRSLCWHDPATGWTIPLDTAVPSPHGQHITLRKWALQEFQLHLAGHRGSVPMHACTIPIGIEIKLELEDLATGYQPLPGP